MPLSLQKRTTHAPPVGGLSRAARFLAGAAAMATTMVTGACGDSGDPAPPDGRPPIMMDARLDAPAPTMDARLDAPTPRADATLDATLDGRVEDASEDASEDAAARPRADATLREAGVMAVYGAPPAMPSE